MSIESIDLTSITKIINFNSYEDYQTYLSDTEPNEAQNTLSIVSGSAADYVDLYYGTSKVSDVWVVDSLSQDYPDDKIFLVPVKNAAGTTVLGYSVYYKLNSQFVLVNQGVPLEETEKVLWEGSVSGVSQSVPLDEELDFREYDYLLAVTALGTFQLYKATSGFFSGGSFYDDTGSGATLSTLCISQSNPPSSSFDVLQNISWSYNSTVAGANTLYKLSGIHLEGSSVKVDSTLSVAGEAADAKAAGDQIRTLQSDVISIESIFEHSAVYTGNSITIDADEGTQSSIDTSATAIMHSSSKNLIDPTWVDDGTNTKRIYGQMVGKNTVSSGAVYGTTSSPINQSFVAGSYFFHWSSSDSTFDNYINAYGKLEYKIGGTSYNISANTAFTVNSDFTLVRIYLSDTMRIVAGVTYDYEAQIEIGNSFTSYVVPTAVPEYLTSIVSPVTVDNFEGYNLYVANASMDLTIDEFGANLIDDSKSTDYTTYSSKKCNSTFAPIPSADTPFEATKSTLSGSDIIRVAAPHAKRNYTISFLAHINTFGKVIIGIGGQSNYVSGWVEIDATNIKIYTKESSSAVLAGTYAHGLTFSQTINVNIRATGINTCEIVLSTVGGQFKTTSPWFGCLGNAFNTFDGRVTAETDGGAFTYCVLKYYAIEYKRDLWGFGDSYFDHWPAVAISDGYGNFAVDGASGRHSFEAWHSLELESAKRLPKKLLWCMGMNDEDSVSAVNSSWLSNYNKVKAFCDEKHIELILSTIPCVPERNNSFKNAIIRSSGYRYVDIADAVGGTETGSSWYTGLLSADNVHPTVAGDKVIAARFMADVPELMDK